MATFAEYVSNRIEAEGDNPSGEIAELYGAITRLRLEQADVSDDLPGLLAALKHVVETDDYDTIAQIGRALSVLAEAAEAEREWDAGPLHKINDAAMATRPGAETSTEDSAAPKLWISSAMSPHGNPYGLVAVVAEARGEALAKAREALAGHDSYVPREQYRQNLLDNLDAQLEEAPKGVIIDWDAAGGRR